MNVVHALLLADRGTEHIHRWAPRCSCGWAGVFRRRKKEAVAQHHRHTSVFTEAGHFSRRGSWPRPRPLTPLSQLPEVLR